MMRWSQAGSLLVAVAALSACGSSSNGNTDGGATGGIPSVCPGYATAICDLYSSCSNGWYIGAQYGDQASCVASYELACAERLAVPGTALTAADILSCSQGLPTEACDNLYSNNPEEVCAAPAGKTALNEPCEASAQCASAYCAVPSNAFCGTCQTAPGPGASCAQFGCPAGLQCLTDVLTCEPGVPDGGACNAIGDCVFGLTCLSKAKTCAPTVAPGQACDTTGKVGPGCNDNLGLVCQRIGDGGVCAQKELADAGQPCGTLSDSGVATNCADRGTCVKTPADAGSGICVAAAAAGASCDTAAGPDCELPARCIITNGGTSGTCELLSTAVCTGDGGSSSPDDGGSDAGEEFYTMGSFTASGADSGAVSANFTGLQSTLVVTAAGGIQFDITAINGDGTSTGTFTSPSGITNYGVSADIYFTGPPAAGMTLTNTNSCGSASIDYGTTAQPFLNDFIAREQGAACSVVTGANAGSYTLSFTSMSQKMGVVGNYGYYLPHGTFTATMPDATGDTGMVSFTF
jgi:hypothetical protein